ncbi:MAG: hypothetical protein GF372_05950 [Candidatus Marinimicrobia bacterium]|nr:hypothetical protein [Candidatus Neomarinimicrobiota bacterium]
MTNFRQIALLLVAVSFVSTLMAQSVNEVINNVQEQVNTDQPLRVEFQQIFEWKLTGKVDSVAGEMVLKGLDKFRITTPDQEIVSNGNTMWTYSRLENQVIIDKIRRDSQSLMPRDVLFKYPEQYETEIWRRDAVVGEQEAIAIRMTPNSQDEFLQETVVWVSQEDWKPLKVQITDLNDNKTVYVITSISIDDSIQETAFTFNPEQSMEIIDVRS